MAFFSEVTARLGLDITSFEKGMAQSVQTAEKTAGAIGKKFSGAHLGTTIATALGLNLQNIAEKLVEPFKQAAEYAQSLAEWTDRSADATERLIRSRQTDSQQLEVMEKRVERLTKKLGDLQTKPAQNSFGPFGLIQRGSALDKLFSLSSESDKAAQSDVAQTAVDLTNAQIDAEAQSKKVTADNTAEIVKQNKEAKQLADTKAVIAELDRKRLPVEEQVTALEKQRSETQKQIASYETFQRQGGQLTLDGAQELKSLKEKERDITAEIADLTKKTGEQIKENTQEVKAFVVAVNTVGRGDDRLSDRELARKSGNLRQDIFTRQLNAQFGGYDPMLSYQRYTLGQLEAEQRLRDETRRNVSAFGSDRAFAMSGLTESRFSEIIGTMTENKKQTDLLDRLNRKLEMGIRVLPVGTSGTATTIK